MKNLLTNRRSFMNCLAAAPALPTLIGAGLLSAPSALADTGPLARRSMTLLLAPLRLQGAWPRRATGTPRLCSRGRVLVAGGGYPGVGLAAAAELYDPALGVFRPTGNLTYPRSGHSAILLANGKFLILCGYGAFGQDVPTAELYDPATGTFMPTASFAGNTGCDFCSPSVLLADGRVLLSATNPAPLYDPTTGFNQVNVRVPASVAPGSAVPVRLAYLGRWSNPVTIAVQ